MVVEILVHLVLEKGKEQLHLEVDHQLYRNVVEHNQLVEAVDHMVGSLERTT